MKIRYEYKEKFYDVSDETALIAEVLLELRNCIEEVGNSLEDSIDKSGQMNDEIGIEIHKFRKDFDRVNCLNGG
jgi:hypothetical protein